MSEYIRNGCTMYKEEKEIKKRAKSGKITLIEYVDDELKG